MTYSRVLTERYRFLGLLLPSRGRLAFDMASDSGCGLMAIALPRAYDSWRVGIFYTRWPDGSSRRFCFRQLWETVQTFQEPKVAFVALCGDTVGMRPTSNDPGLGI